jgi:hypothetical protein
MIKEMQKATGEASQPALRGQEIIPWTDVFLIIGAAQHPVPTDL